MYKTSPTFLFLRKDLFQSMEKCKTQKASNLRQQNLIINKETTDWTTYQQGIILWSVSIILYQTERKNIKGAMSRYLLLFFPVLSNMSMKY